MIDGTLQQSKTQRLKTILRSESAFRLGFILFAKIAGGLSIIALHILVSRQLGISQYGHFALFIATALLLGSVTHAGWMHSVIPLLKRYEIRWRWGNYRGVLIQSLVTTIGISILCSIALALAGYVFVDDPAQRLALLLACAVAPLYGLSALLKGLFKSIDLPHISVLPEEVALPVLFALFLFVIGASTLKHAMLIYSVIMVVLIAIAFIYAFKKLPAAARVAKARFLGVPWLLYTLPMFAGDIGNIAIARTDLIMLSILSDSVQTAQYSAGFRIASVLMLASVAISPIYAPKFAEARVRRDRRKGIRLLLQSVGLAVPFVTLPYIIIMAVPEYLLSFFGPDFPDGALTLRIIATAFFLHVITGPVALFVLMNERQKTYAVIAGAAGATNIIAAYLFIPAFGAVGAACSTMLTFVVWKAMLLKLAHTLGSGVGNEANHST